MHDRSPLQCAAWLKTLLTLNGARAALNTFQVAEALLVNVKAVLLSPVAWIHHFHWIVVVIFAVLFVGSGVNHLLNL